MTPEKARSSTTITLSIKTLGRIRALGGVTVEDTIVEALTMLEDSRLDDTEFWAQADAAFAWEASLPEEERALLKAESDAIDTAFDGTK